jgi:transcriptional regulator with XRE-family HTH domain
MDKNNKGMIATLVKDGRIAKGYTQKELAELTNISIRSIQRIENASLLPRSYTLKTIAQALDLPFTAFFETAEKENDITSNKTSFSLPQEKILTKAQQVILSIATPLLVIFLAIAFISQSNKFPETTFELMLFWTIVTILITTALYFIWQSKK